MKWWAMVGSKSSWSLSVYAGGVWGLFAVCIAQVFALLHSSPRVYITINQALALLHTYHILQASFIKVAHNAPLVFLCSVETKTEWCQTVQQQGPILNFEFVGLEVISDCCIMGVFHYTTVRYGIKLDMGSNPQPLIPNTKPCVMIYPWNFNGQDKAT